MGAPLRYQPQGLLRINRSNPLARGLVLVLHPLSPAINLVDSSALTDPYGQGASWLPVANKAGRGVANSASTSFRIASNGAWAVPAGAAAAVVAIPRILSPAANSFLDFAASGWHASSIYLGDGTNPRFCAGNNGSGLQFTTAPTDYVVGTPYTVVATTTTSAQMLAINGAIVAQTAYSPGALSSPHQFTLYSPSATARVVEVNLTLIWNRPLTADEAVSISQNPWQIFDAGSGGSAYQAAIASIGAPAGGATNTAISPGAGALALTGYIPTVQATARQSATPGAGTLAISGYAPTIAQPHAATPGAGAVGIVGYAPVITQAVNQNVVPAAGALSVTGYAPSVARTAGNQTAPAAGSLSITGYQPTIAQTQKVALSPGAGQVQLTGYAPTVAQTAPIITLSVRFNILPRDRRMKITHFSN